MMMPVGNRHHCTFIIYLINGKIQWASGTAMQRIKKQENTNENQ
jgi:hypothetical protein